MFLDRFLKAFWGTVIIAVIIFCFTGCSAEEQPETAETARFEVEPPQRVGAFTYAYIFSDTETGRQYLYIQDADGAGLTLLEPAEVIEPEPEPVEPEPEEPTRFELTDTERQLVEQVVMGEAGSEPYCGQIAIAQCILTACEKDGLRPSEVVELYQYTPNRPEPSESVTEAVSAVFDRGEVAFKDKPLWFYAPDQTISAFHERQRLVGIIGGHKFFGEWEKA